MSKRVLVCAYFARNIGDDLFLKTLFDRYPDVKWDLLTANRHYRKIFKHYKHVKIIYSYREIKIGKKFYNLFFKLNELLFKYKKYDALINIGGSIFMQGSGWKIKIREREYLVKKFKKQNKKVFILGANFGPYKDKEFLSRYRDLFEKYDDICFRDLHTYNKFKDLSNVRIAPDIVFALDNMMNTKKDKSIGISIINLEGREGLQEYYHKYNEKMAEISEAYINKGYQIKFFSFCENEGDLKAINDIKNKINPQFRNELETINYDGQINTFLEKFSSCKAIVGARFHSIILAIINKQGFYPIIYSNKTSNVLMDLNMEEPSCHIKDIEQLEIQNVMKITETNIIEDKVVLSKAINQFKKLDLLLKNKEFVKG